MKLKFIIIALCLLFVGANLSVSSNKVLGQEANQKVLERTAPKERFIDLFRKERGQSVTPEATRYLLACCKSRDEAIQLLKDNGFAVNIVSDPKQAKELNANWKTTTENYDEFISGTRGAGLWRFWDIFAQYRVALW